MVVDSSFENEYLFKMNNHQTPNLNKTSTKGGPKTKIVKCIITHLWHLLPPQGLQSKFMLANFRIQVLELRKKTVYFFNMQLAVKTKLKLNNHRLNKTDKSTPICYYLPFHDLNCFPSFHSEPK